MRVGVNLAGYFDSTLGVGHVARRLREALEAAGVPVAAVGLHADSGAPLDPPSEGLVPPGGANHPVNVLCVNPDGLEGAREELGAAFFEGRPTAGFWWWEAGAVPDRWLRGFDLLDEVWAGSRHVADMLAAVSPRPVVRMPVPVSVEPASLGREELGLPEGFLFLCAYDYGSVAERKHPLGAIEAFRRAFPGEDGVALVLKCLRPDLDPEAHARVLEAAAEDPRVSVVDRAFAAPEKDALLAACDCFLSLHRAEGFGFPLAEALLLGRPVVATAWSGPLDFLTPLNSFLVDYRLVPIGPGREPYPAGGEWAEPDLDDAAALLRQVFAEPGAALRRAARGREDVARAHSPAAAGRAMGDRAARVAHAPAAAAGHDLDELERRIRARPPEPGPGSLGGLRRGLQSAVLRLIRAHTTHQRHVNEELLATLRALDERARGLAAIAESLAARLDRLERRRGSDD